MTKRQPITITSTVSGLVNDFYSIAQELRDELQEWKDNIEEKFSNTDKFSRLEEAVSTLEEFCESEPDTDLEGCDEDFTYTVMPGKKKPSRADRMSDAIDSANRALDRLNELKQALEEKEEARQKLVQEHDDLKEEIAELECSEHVLPGLIEEKNARLADMQELLSEDEIDTTIYDDLISTLEDHIGTAENVEFPGMFG